MPLAHAVVRFELGTLVVAAVATHSVPYRAQAVAVADQAVGATLGALGAILEALDGHRKFDV